MPSVLTQGEVVDISVGGYLICIRKLWQPVQAVRLFPKSQLGEARAPHDLYKMDGWMHSLNYNMRYI